MVIESEAQFWDELDDIVSTPCRTHDRIDDTLRTWLEFSTNHRDSYLQTELAVSRCSHTLLSSSLVKKEGSYIRHQLVYVLLQEDEPFTLHLVSTFLSLDGHQDEEVYKLLNSEGIFTKLVQLVKDGIDDDLGLHRQMLMLLYEMSRTQELSKDNLTSVDDAFVFYLLHIIEELSSDVNDPYHHPVMRVLLVLNEQYMVCAHDPASTQSFGPGLTNRVIKVLSIQGDNYKTFGQNLILLLNRESETSIQLLILKLFYMLFTTKSTQEYFYTNDLHVLIDILMRNLLDLPEGTAAASLRHTYLRVIHPVLANSQLRVPPHYKRDELRRMLDLLADAGANHRHFERPDETTLRLVARCLAVDWLREETDGLEGSDEIPKGAGSAVVANRALGLTIPEARESSISVVEVASLHAKPGEHTPSKKRDANEEKSPFDDDVLE